MALGRNNHLFSGSDSGGLVTGLFLGFFGIGGDFLIVPGLVGATGMPMPNAVGTTLVAVTAFGVTTAVNYTASGLIDRALALVFISGGMLGSIFGAKIAKRLSGTTGRLTTVFAAIVFVVASYMLVKTFKRI